MNSRLSGSELAKIMTETCPKLPGFPHCFRLDPESILEVECRWCGLEIDFTTYTCDRTEQAAAAVAPGDRPAAPQPDTPAPEWLDPAFHAASCFRLPSRSSLIEPTLFWYYLDFILDERIPTPGDPAKDEHAALIRIPGIRFYEKDKKNIPDRIEEIDSVTGIKRVFVDSGYTPLFGTVEAWFSERAEEAAWFNLRKLLAGKFKPEHQAEALAEIEHQLSKVPPLWGQEKEAPGDLRPARGMEAGASSAERNTKNAHSGCEARRRGR